MVKSTKQDGDEEPELPELLEGVEEGRRIFASIEGISVGVIATVTDLEDDRGDEARTFELTAIVRENAGPLEVGDNLILRAIYEDSWSDVTARREYMDHETDDEIEEELSDVQGVDLLAVVGEDPKPEDEVLATGDGGQAELVTGDAGDDAGDGIDRDDPDKCHALVSGGRQCGNGYQSNAALAEERLCGTHASARNLSRIDAVDGEPVATLRDELAEAGLASPHAYALATLTDDVQELWRLATGLEDVDVGGKTYEASTLATLADEIATHPDVDAGAHPLSEESCVAIISKGAHGESYQCETGSYGARLLCGMHDDVNDLRTIYDREGGPDLPRATIDGEEYLAIERRGEDLVAVALPEYEVVRLEGAGDLLAPLEQAERDAVDPATNAPDWANADAVTVTWTSVHSSEPQERTGEILDVGLVVDDEYGPTGTPRIVVDDPEDDNRNLVLWPARDDLRGEYVDGSHGERSIGDLVDVEPVATGGEDKESLSDGDDRDQDARAGLTDLEEGARLRVTLADGREYTGVVSDTGTGGWRDDRESVYLREVESVRDVLIVEQHRDGEGGWSEDLVAVDFVALQDDPADGRQEIGTVAEIERLEPEDVLDRERAREIVLEEIATLLDRGLSPGQALDYYATEAGGEIETDGSYSQTAWSERRGRSPQAISGSVRNAREALEDE